MVVLSEANDPQTLAPAQGPIVERAAEEIIREHNAAHDAAESAIEHAVRCGELLIAQQKRVGHGKFKQWIADNLPFSYESANRYMLVARSPKMERVKFSSVRQLIDHARGVKQRERLISANRAAEDLQKQKEHGVQPGHDLEAYAAYLEVGRIILWFEKQMSGLDPMRLHKGSTTLAREKLRPHLHRAMRFLVTLAAMDGFTPVSRDLMAARQWTPESAEAEVDRYLQHIQQHPPEWLQKATAEPEAMQ